MNWGYDGNVCYQSYRLYHRSLWENYDCTWRMKWMVNGTWVNAPGTGKTAFSELPITLKVPCSNTVAYIAFQPLNRHMQVMDGSCCWVPILTPCQHYQKDPWRKLRPPLLPQSQWVGGRATLIGSPTVTEPLPGHFFFLPQEWGNAAVLRLDI